MKALVDAGGSLVFAAAAAAVANEAPQFAMREGEGTSQQRTAVIVTANGPPTMLIPSRAGGACASHTAQRFPLLVTCLLPHGGGG